MSSMNYENKINKLLFNNNFNLVTNSGKNKCYDYCKWNCIHDSPWIQVNLLKEQKKKNGNFTSNDYEEMCN